MSSRGWGLLRGRQKTASIFRSEVMSLVQLYIPSDVARYAVSQLGEIGLVQFRDLNSEVSAFQRSFVSDVRRFDEIERKLRYLHGQLERSGVDVYEFLDDGFVGSSRGPRDIDDMEERISAHDDRVQRLTAAYKNLQLKRLELLENKYVLEEVSSLFSEMSGRQATGGPRGGRASVATGATGGLDAAPLLARVDTSSRRSIGSLDAVRGHDAEIDIEVGDVGRDINVGFIAGVIPRERIATLERVLWRSLRGNMFLNYVDIEDPISDPKQEEPVYKSAFIVFAHGASLRDRATKIAESLGATLYQVDSSAERRQEDLIDTMSRLDDLQQILENNAAARVNELTGVSEQINTWFAVVRKEKAIYHTLNLFNYDANRNCLIAEGWCATNDIPAIQSALHLATEDAGSNVPTVLQELRTTKEPPTFIRTNKFTDGFQNIVDAYGVPKAGEVNPGLFTCITFPFLFALMFGDLGHGALMTLGAALLCVYEQRLAWLAKSESLRMFYSGRYIVLLMGLFSMFTGLLYNDLFSRAMPLFRSGWAWPADRGGEGVTVEATRLGGVYPIGIDPAWHHASNSLLFTNSYKMKMSIVLGVVHMTLGICLQVPNALHFRKRINIIHVFVPQVIFLFSIFGYLVFAILFKWSTDWYARDAAGELTHISPPSLLNMLIYMFLSPGHVSESERMFRGQAALQTVLLLLALACVPWMLLVKPLILRREHQKIVSEGYGRISSHVRASSDGEGLGAAVIVAEQEEMEEDDFDFADLMINQSIHTIEFCLNSISNTASYLRLWALSLAHAQLSEVLWTMTFMPTLKMSGSLQPAAIVCGFAVWFVLTVGILIGMEGLSAFLHALRLHWVEFNNKFYDGTGVKFEPFSFRAVLDEAEEQQ
ncbi:H(+)-transporting V0 sector ATPase subunit a [Coemansia nantahalensis]|uniref:H(+)-transporting V0 sector ATPase subunit a n=2 Tax=Coemansia TaxID=4863 RepID=A0ACC1L164_9FUNG|nr:H(+)-transporting V0 sector ATPase subunit a [Coemansia nantahalensis]KAJ2774124.1 H(+)-transporting V0 sector ATPase subunit a [Coemansia nantahalensis]KAJ2798980.1 H(+)-transporting V0 sector ATPase subunit a [Coemansia helicoidea]